MVVLAQPCQLRIATVMYPSAASGSPCSVSGTVEDRVARVLRSGVAKQITERELRNDSGEISRQPHQGESFIVTRNGIPVGELSPVRRHRFISAEAADRRVQGRSAGGVRPVPSRSRSGRQPGDRTSWLRPSRPPQADRHTPQS